MMPVLFFNFLPGLPEKEIGTDSRSENCDKRRRIGRVPLYFRHQKRFQRTRPGDTSHDHHRDNLDDAGRALLCSDAVDAVISTPAAARRLRLAKVSGLRTGDSTALGAVTVRAVAAQHGPRWVPQTGQVTGFELTAAGEPSVWLSGDTVLTDVVREAARSMRGIDVAVINAGGVRFPSAPLVGKALFTFTPEQFVEVCRLADPRVIIPVHRSGWSHFQPENDLRRALDAAGLLERTRWLGLGESTETV